MAGRTKAVDVVRTEQFSDFRMTLGEFGDKVQELRKEYGDSAVISADAGYEHVTVVLMVPYEA